jgi:chloramphenicol 3-O-phosphotransferase
VLGDSDSTSVEGLLLCNRLLSGFAGLCVSVKANEALPTQREQREYQRERGRKSKCERNACKEKEIHPKKRANL